jgi:hypothetical protein
MEDYYKLYQNVHTVQLLLLGDQKLGLYHHFLILLAL